MDLIGIDCATQPNKVGLALAQWDGAVARIQECRTASAAESPIAIVNRWLQQSGTALLALDAPLGWPQALTESLVSHRAGAGMGASAHALFRRRTDDAIHRRFRKRPLEVGANFISRTAVAALDLLEQLRVERAHSIPLAWHPNALERISAIEVYPAATRLAHRSTGRGGSLDGLGHALDLTALGGRLPASADAVDALVCVIAAADFLRGLAPGPGPADWASAQQEGWIWTAEPLSSASPAG